MLGADCETNRGEISITYSRLLIYRDEGGLLAPTILDDGGDSEPVHQEIASSAMRCGIMKAISIVIFIMLISHRLF